MYPRKTNNSWSLIAYMVSYWPMIFHCITCQERGTDLLVAQSGKIGINTMRDAHKVDMLERIEAYIEEHALLPEDGEVVVAVSGGADSLCLLHLLHRLCGPGKRFPGVRLRVAHLNHKLREEADAEAEAVARIASAWGLPVTLGEMDVPALAREEGRSLEEAAREARYRFLRAVACGPGSRRIGPTTRWTLSGGSSCPAVVSTAKAACTHSSTISFVPVWRLHAVGRRLV